MNNYAYFNLDSRPCYEKIHGPLRDDNSTPPFQFCVADENNTVILHCRVICQEHGAYYTPHIRIITTKDGEVIKNTCKQLHYARNTREKASRVSRKIAIATMLAMFIEVYSHV